MDLNLETVLNGLQQATNLETSGALDLHAILLPVTFLLTHEEYSVREYAELTIQKHLPQVSE